MKSVKRDYLLRRRKDNPGSRTSTLLIKEEPASPLLLLEKSVKLKRSPKIVQVSNASPNVPKRTETKRFVCEYCNYATENNSYLRQHIRRHTGEKPYACDFEGCSFRFVCKSDLKEHKYSHAPGTKPFPCDVAGCPFRGTKMKHLKQHMNGVNGHPTEINKPYACDFEGCSFRSSSKSYLAVHGRKVHALGETKLVCKYCGVYVNKGVLKNHIMRHIGDKPYNACDFKGCLYQSVSKDDLTKHKFIMHAPDTKHHVCQHCGHATQCARTLREHLKRHTCENVCDYKDCQYRCASTGGLKSHKYLMHMGKPFSCDLCSFRTAEQGNLKRHRITHLHKTDVHRVQKYNELCPFQFLANDRKEGITKKGNEVEVDAKKLLKADSTNLEGNSKFTSKEDSESKVDSEVDSEDLDSDSVKEDVLRDELKKVVCSRYTISNKGSSADVFVISGN